MGVASSSAEVTIPQVVFSSQTIVPDTLLVSYKYITVKDCFLLTEYLTKFLKPL